MATTPVQPEVAAETIMCVAPLVEAGACDNAATFGLTWMDGPDEEQANVCDQHVAAVAKVILCEWQFPIHGLVRLAQAEAAESSPSDPYQGQMCPHCHTVCYGDCRS